MMTGYFANETTGRHTKVHLVYDDCETLCGSKIKFSMSFYWCANLPIIEYVDCQHCQRIYNRDKMLFERIVKHRG